MQWPVELLAGFRKRFHVLPSDRSKIYRKMQESDAQFVRNLSKVRRQRLTGRLTVRAVIHNAAHTLFGQKPHVVLEQLPGNINLWSQFEHPNLQIVLFQFFIPCHLQSVC